MKTLYLIPTVLSAHTERDVLPHHNIEIINSLRYFIVENIRTARRFLKAVNKDIDIDELQFFELNQHTDRTQINKYLEPLKLGNNMGIISEAGCPAIADPGADVVALAQQAGFNVKPMVGPSSILLSLMASGFNGQSFAFHGYLPIEKDERIKKLKYLESLIYIDDQTQIFIETPYRNMQLVETLQETLQASTKLCIAADLTSPDEYIKTLNIAQWKKTKIPDIHKHPCIFLLFK